MMFCRVCREFPSISESTSAFVTGTSNFRKDPIRTHEKSLHHKKCIGAQSAASVPEQTPIAKTILKINQAQQEVLKKLFRTAYYVAKSELPLAKFSSLCKLQKANGLDLGSTYLNDHACREFIGAIAQTSRDQIEKEIQESRFLSILADGSTDTGIIEQELVHVRYVRDNGDIATYMIKPVKSANAAGILEAIDEAVNTMGIREDTWKKKVVCANFDGAAVMMGEKTGVAGRLKQRIPHIITIHCVAHKLELAVLDSVKGCEYLVKFEDTLKTIFKMYYYSPKKRRELTEISELLNERLAHFSGLKSTRWLPSRLRCLKAVEKNYTPTVVHMENMAEGSDVKAEDAAKAKGVVQEMKTEKFVRFLHFMLDYSTVLSKCCTDFQHDNLNITRTNQLVESTTSRLLSLKTKPGEYQKTLDTKFTANQDGSICYCGTQLTKSQRPARRGEGTDKDTFGAEIQKIIDNTVKYMDNRFKNLHEKPLSCFKVFDPCTLPYPREELANYGDEEVDYLVTHFACLLDAEEKEKIPQEWMDLKVWLAERRGRKVDCLYRALLSENPEHLSHILLLVKLMLTLSPSTAICERGFSCMNRVKTTHRTSLHPETLNDCMQLSINGETVESFCPDKSIRFWMFSGKGSRHLDHKTPTRTKSSEMEGNAQEEKADEGDAMPSTSSGIFSSETSVEISDSGSDTD
ncbi:zinc finger protein 862-like [Oreochromis aureus]|uniref:zinc finger protein 862-like n=1 Tax=Oreochromis aureus TaxID=47969 RepID=UPI001953F364|nr:zinc finger protein 862-like [Oreochromis aureus]